MKPAKFEIGDEVTVNDTSVKGKITHIRNSQDEEWPHKYKVEGKYWNENSLTKVGDEKSPVTEGKIDEQELEYYINQNSDLYDRYYIPIIKNLSKKKKSGVYDSQLAIKGFMYLVDEGAKRYVKEFDAGSRVQDVFNRQARLKVAEMFKNKFESEYEDEEYDFMRHDNTKSESILSKINKILKEGI